MLARVPSTVRGLIGLHRLIQTGPRLGQCHHQTAGKSLPGRSTRFGLWRAGCTAAGIGHAHVAAKLIDPSVTAIQCNGQFTRRPSRGNFALANPRQTALQTFTRRTVAAGNEKERPTQDTKHQHQHQCPKKQNEKKADTQSVRLFFGLRRILNRSIDKIWSGKRDSNSRPQPWQGCALPTELFPHFVISQCFIIYHCVSTRSLF